MILQFSKFLHGKDYQYILIKLSSTACPKATRTLNAEEELLDYCCSCCISKVFDYIFLIKISNPNGHYNHWDFIIYGGTMIHKIGTIKQSKQLRNTTFDEVFDKVADYIYALDLAYGTNRDYNTIGGYVLYAETATDMADIKAVVDIFTALFEWIDVIDDNYIAILYLLGDDFSVVAIIPQNCMTETMKDYINKVNDYENN